MIHHIEKVLLLAIMAVAGGCSSAERPATVTGTVTFDGKPVTGGTIGFIPADGRPYQGDIQADGSYRVENVPLGECIVIINPPAVDDSARFKVIKDSQGNVPPTPPPPFPLRYADMQGSDLRYVVKSGENVYKAEMRR
jgi:hypothetical protein